jgi:3-deoxy-D-manno-octulosonate 8-phosphate phosphatase KdsC-like HAD superfamily phosphatase
MNYKAKLHAIKAFVFDFDGVMTDGNVWTFADRETVR